MPILRRSIDHYLVTRVAVCTPHQCAAEIRADLLGADLDTADDVAVCDRVREPRRLLGLVPVQRLLTAADDTLAATLMDADPPIIVAGTSPEQAAWKAVHHGESSLAVVGADGAFRGLVPSSRLLGIVLAAHDEDFARLGGYLASTESARLATREPLTRRLWHRLPWLAVGLAGAALAAWLVGLFEGRLAADIRLAFFMPGVVYLADAVGTQTEAIVVRGLSVGAPMRTTFRLEALTGPAIGLALGAVSLPAVWWAFGDAEVAVAVSVALALACAAATLIAAVLPWAMSRAGRDPAFGSGPLATVVQDLLSLLIYFLAASLLVGAA